MNPAAITIHNHGCQACGHVFPCEDPKENRKPLEKCKVSIAVKANANTGPFCERCRHGIMFIRYTWNRRQSPRDWLRRLEQLEHPET